MSEVFQRYAAYYDLYCRNKDYVAECDYVRALFARHSSTPVRELLDLGCGTGGHAIPWAKAGLQVTAIDRSDVMLNQARDKAAAAGVHINFVESAIERLNLGRTYDAVTCMFNVIGYLVTDEDVLQALRCARRHLRPGGLFVFDGWYGPAVLAQRPEVRQTTIPMGQDDGAIHRGVEPELDEQRHLVTVHFTIRRVEANRQVEEFQESHVVRFFFAEEIETLLIQAGFEVAAFTPFLALEGAPGPQDWSFTLVARAVPGPV